MTRSSVCLEKIEEKIKWKYENIVGIKEVRTNEIWKYEKIEEKIKIQKQINSRDELKMIEYDEFSNEKDAQSQQLQRFRFS